MGVLAAPHSAIFDISLESARESAESRTRATVTVDGITGRRSTDVARDWRTLETQLQACYRSLAAVLAADGAGPT